MAVEAVPSEPLSRPDSLLSVINTGIFHGLCSMPHQVYALKRSLSPPLSNATSPH
jgi:hypothetical protein